MYFHYPLSLTLWCDDSVCGDFSKLLGCVWYQSCVPSAFNRQSSKPSGPHFCKEAWGETEENLSVSNSIFLHNVLGLSGTCLINFIYSSDRQSYPPCFFISISSFSSFFFPSSTPSGPGQWNTLRRSRGQAALDEEEEAEAGRCCGCEGRPLSQVYDQSQVHRCLHSQYVWERSGRHHGHWPGRGQPAIQTLNWGSRSINDCVQNTRMPVID